jgi:hypothetical protein
MLKKYERNAYGGLMKLASNQGMSLETALRDVARQFSPWFQREQAAAQEKALRVTDVVDDSYSEAINFRFVAKGRAYRGLVTYDALRESAKADAYASREPALALFIRRAQEVGESAAAKLERDGVEPVVLADGDI